MPLLLRVLQCNDFVDVIFAFAKRLRYLKGQNNTRTTSTQV